MPPSLPAADARKAAQLFLALVFPLGFAHQALVAWSAPTSTLRTTAPIGQALIPYLCLVATVWIREGKVPDPGLSAPSPLYPLVAYLTALAIAGGAWLTAVGSGDFIPRVPWDAAEPFGGVPGLVAFYLVVGFAALLARAAIEELAWRGVLLPCLRLAGSPAPGLASAALWTAWRFPLAAVLLAERTPDPGYLYGVLALNFFAMGIILARERTFTRSLWPAAVFKAAFDLFYLNLFPLFFFAGPDADTLVGPAGVMALLYLGPVAGLLVVGGRLDEEEQDPPAAAAFA